MRHTVKIHSNETVKQLEADEGTNLLELLRKNDINVNTPCGGKGTCGKCAVKVSGLKAEPYQNEMSHLGAERLARGYRLACSCKVDADIDIYAGSNIAQASIITGGKNRKIALLPVIKKQYVEMEAPSLEDQKDDTERLRQVCDSDLLDVDISVVQELPELFRKYDYKVTAISYDGKLIGVEGGDTSRKLFGTAFDIGTTTIAAYLYDLRTGVNEAVCSALNPQGRYGADVIARISYTQKSKACRQEMQRLITECINELNSKLAEKAGTERENIYLSVFAGNTTMLHLLLGLDASAIAVSPFVPAMTELKHFSAETMNIKINKHGIGVVFPCVSAYVGGDTVAAVLSSGMYDKTELSLLVDIGTNGEIVLGNSEFLLACSTAAGPAFEGANIRNGVGGIEGAIDTVGAAPDFKYTTIGEAAPVGICGSGIIDAIYRLVQTGIVDETGRLVDEDEEEQLESSLRQRLADIDGSRSFVIANEGDRDVTSSIVITQRDIRELQNAKAAIAAGIDTLLKLSGKDQSNIERIYLAGGFGSKINVESAIGIGLLPRQLGNRVEAIGNASGIGASEGLLSANTLELSKCIKKKIKYIELSSSAFFTERYVENMMF